MKFWSLVFEIMVLCWFMGGIQGECLAANLQAPILTSNRPESAVDNSNLIIQAPPLEAQLAEIKLSLPQNPSTINQPKSSGSSKWQLEPSQYSQLIRIDRDKQRLYYYQDGKLIHTFVCSTSLTGRAATGDKNPKGIHDHIGVFSIHAKERSHYSRQYDVAMPYALRFFGGHFIHATTKIRQLGRPASHGCVRLHPRDAKTLYAICKVGCQVEIH